jgi:hypothetical protein
VISKLLKDAQEAQKTLHTSAMRLDRLHTEALKLPDLTASDRLEKKVVAEGFFIKRDVLANRKVLEDLRLAQISFEAPTRALESTFTDTLKDFSIVVKKEQEGEKVLRSISVVVGLVGQYAAFNLNKQIEKETKKKLK